MRKFLLQITAVIIAALSFIGCSELDDIAYPLDRTMWVTENPGVSNDYYIEFERNRFYIYYNNTGELMDSGTYDYDYDYPCDMVYLYGRDEDYVLEYDEYKDWLIDVNMDYIYERGVYNR